MVLPLRKTRTVNVSRAYIKTIYAMVSSLRKIVMVLLSLVVSIPVDTDRNRNNSFL